MAPTNLPGPNCRLDSFDFHPGRRLLGKYEVVRKIGTGWEGEVYLLVEQGTGIERAGKFIYPQRNPGNKTLLFYARKLHQLRHCPILIHYHTVETIRYRGIPVTFLVSEYVEGELLSRFLDRQRGKRLSLFQGLHLLHALVKGLESIHAMGEYHGDLHTDNVMIARFGLNFELKIYDMFHWGGRKRENMEDDLCDMIRIFYDALGGNKHYARHPQEIKAICCGLKRSLILKKFKTVHGLRHALETLHWKTDSH